MKDHLIGLVLRHGETKANQEEKVRSWTDVPLDTNGIAQAKTASAFLKKYPVRHILCSPLLRAFMTADIAAAPHKLTVYQHRGMFPWNLGIFGGLPKDSTAAAVRLFVKNREVQAPGGESLDAFEDRIFAFFDASLKLARVKGLTLYVCHNSTITALAHMMAGPEANHLQDTVKPGGVAEIYFNGKQHQMRPVFGIPEKSQFGAS